MKCLPTQRLVPGFFVGGDDVVSEKGSTEIDKIGQDLKFDTKISKKSGLNNLGNSCFLNSVIQCLAYTPGFEYFVSHLPNKLYDQNIGKPMFLHHLSDLFQAMSLFPTVAPHVFYANLTQICSSMKAGEQQDANEFLLALLNRFEDECGPNSSAIKSFFGGELTDIIQCQTCGRSIRRESSFLDISLPNNGETVEECFENMMKSRSEDNIYQCEFCGKVGSTVNSQCLSKSPNILIITMMRFSPSGCRVQNSASFDTFLDLSKYTEEETSSSYELYGIVNHSGHRIDRGHFSSYVKSSDGQWFSSDDSKVKPENKEVILQAKPYILFYKKKEVIKARFGRNLPLNTSQKNLSKSTSEPNTFHRPSPFKISLSAGV